MDFPVQKFKEISEEPNKDAKELKDPQLWRDLTAYWILGLCNNFGYVVMLCAAYDIFKKFNADHIDVNNTEPNERDCNIISTGVILLADTLPAIGIKFVAPLLPLWIHCEIFLAIATQAIGFLLVAFATQEWMAILGVIFTSFSYGLGDSTLMAYSAIYNKNVISTWSSGTGAAGVAGALAYAGLISLHVSPTDTVLIMIAFPVLEALVFWILLRHPNSLSTDQLSENKEITSKDPENNFDDEKPLMSLWDKFLYVGDLSKYTIPLITVYLFEYLVNQGMYELVNFKNISIDKDAQYRWLQFSYQLGAFFAKSSVNIFPIHRIWILSVLQFINIIFFSIEVIFYVTPIIWILFAIAFYEGALGGASYVNAFYRLSKEISPARKPFALGVVALADSVGIAAAGFLAMPVHNAICRLPLPVRKNIF